MKEWKKILNKHTAYFIASFISIVSVSIFVFKKDFNLELIGSVFIAILFSYIAIILLFHKNILSGGGA